MSGGAFDYVQYRIGDAIDSIEREIKNNRKTVMQRWEETPEEDRYLIDEYSKPWTKDNFPYWVEREAMKSADKELGLEKTGRTIDFSKWSKAKRKKWNDAYAEAMDRMINEHNNSYIGRDFEDATIENIKKMLKTIKMAQIFIERIDYLFEGDDGQENFMSRTKEDLEEAGLKWE